MRAPDRPPDRVTPARAGTVALVAVVAAGLFWLLLDTLFSGGQDPLPLPWTAVAGTAALAAVVVSVGLPVRQWVRGRRDRPLDPLFAARAFVLAKAAAYGGAVLFGWYLAQALTTLPDLVGVRRTRFWLALLAAAAAVAVAEPGSSCSAGAASPDDLDEDDPRRDPL